MSDVINLEDLFLDHLKDIYYAEKKILKALPKMAKKLGKDSELAEAFEKHFEETQGQVERLEKVFDLIGEKAKAKKCEALDGLAEEAEELMKEVKCKETLAAGLLAGAQAVEHYEIARYGTLIEWAKLLGHDEAAELLEETLEEEKNTDELLNKMAVDGINKAALDAQEERQSEDDEEHPKRRAA
ncbi:MAG: ferritin-like domain-containing protein [Bdellovibrionales bacterium]